MNYQFIDFDLKMNAMQDLFVQKLTKLLNRVNKHGDIILTKYTPHETN